MRVKSRMAKVAIGCGSVLALFVLLGLFSLAFLLDKPAPIDLTTSNLEQSLDNLDTLADGTPLILHIDADYTELSIQRGETNRVEVKSNYDQANFDLVTQRQQGPKGIDYRVSFKSKRNPLATLFNNVIHNEESSADDNQVSIYLPADRPVALNLNLLQTDTNLNLDGLAISSIDGMHRMGELLLKKGDMNPLLLERLAFEYQAASAEFYGLQNLNFEEGHFSGQGGDLRLYTTGDLAQDASLNFDNSFGELLVHISPGVEVDVQLEAIAAKIKDRKSEAEEVRSRLTLTGEMTMGEVNIQYPGTPRWFREHGRMLIYAGKLDEALTLYRELQSEDPEYFGPWHLNNTGYHFLARKNYPAAVALFELNVKLYPDYANGYDSLGEGYLNAGQLEEALQSYEKYLSMKDSDHARKMIAEIKNRMANAS